MSCKKHKLKTKIKPYGGIRKRVWCDGCDAELVSPAPKKRTERQKAKKEAWEESELADFIRKIKVTPLKNSDNT